MKYLIRILILLNFFCLSLSAQAAWCGDHKSEKRQGELEQLQKTFAWWPTDAQPAPVKDEKRGGYWWWPDQPGEARPWGNRGYVYVYKIIYDYAAPDEDELVEIPKKEEPKAVQPVREEPKQPDMKPSLLIKNIIKNVKIYFDYNKADLRDDHLAILNKAVKTLQRNPESTILITGNCDTRGSDEYNLKLGKKRGDAVRRFMLDQGISEDRIKIVSRGKLDAVAPVNDLVGMQKDRNAQFMIAEVEEMLIPEGRFPEEKTAKIIGENKYSIEKEEKIESPLKVSQKEYVIAKNDTLWKIAERELGNGHRWKYIYELNKNQISNPNKLKPGQTIIIPVE